MAEHDIGMASVERLSDAKTGDTVWLFESQMNLHVNGEYKGRGVWRLRPVSSETRVSLVVDGSKFDKTTGAERARNGYSSGNVVAGEREKSDRLWRSENAHRLVRHLEGADTATLRKIAALIGWAG